MPAPKMMLLPRRAALTDAERIARAKGFSDELAQRRTVRDYCPPPVPRAVIDPCLRAAGPAPPCGPPAIAARMDQLIAAGHGADDVGIIAVDALLQ